MHVLWISGDESALRAERDQLARRFDFDFCVTGELLGKAIAQCRPDALCFELGRDEVRTLESVMFARLKHPALAVLLISESLSESLARAALRLRISDLLVKPLDPRALDEALGKLSESLVGPSNVEQRLSSSFAAPRFHDRNYRSTQPALALIHANLHRHISLSECARACNLSPCEFSRRFRAEHSLKFSMYVLKLRIEDSALLLIEGKHAVSDVAYAVGFNDLSYFGRVFRRFMGVPASAYRANRQAMGESRL
jgi:AraC-like DNA-binding protein